MIDKKALNKIYEKFHLVKRPNKLQREAEQKLKSLTKNPGNLDKSEVLPIKRKNFFAPISEFISLGSANLNVSKLYESKLLPSQFLSTSTKTIGRLTREIYFSKKKSKSFSIKALDERCKPELKQRKKRQSLLEKAENKSLISLNQTCDKLIRDNQRSLRYFVKKNKILDRETKITKNLLDTLKKVPNDEENKLFEEKLRECHVVLTKLDRIRPKRKDRISLME